jgi:SPP1 family predicted phage head-tail adaptor
MSSSRYPTEIAIRAGRLRHRVTIEKRVESRSATGAVQFTWTTHAANVPAEIIHGKGKEVFQSDQQQNWIFATVTIKFVPGITTKMRVNNNGVLYDISAILPDPSQQSYLDLWCAQGINLG